MNSKKNIKTTNNKKKTNKSLEKLNEKDIEELMKGRSYKRVGGSIRQTRYKRGDNHNG